MLEPRKIMNQIYTGMMMSMKFSSCRNVLISVCGVLSVMCCQQIASSPLTYKIEPVAILTENLGPMIKQGPSAVWITNLDQLRAAWPEVDLKSPQPGSNRSLAKFDFSTYGLLLISMGEMRTGGHSLVLKPEKAELVDGVARIYVDWIKPERGKLVTQVVTRPCVLVQLRQGIFNHIEVLDKNGGLRTRISL